MPANKSIKRVLVAPLDWGLGHATRCIPLIRAMISSGLEVIIASSGSQAILLQAEFPGLPFLPLEGYRIRYSKRALWLPLVLVRQLPRLLAMIAYENRWLQKTITSHQIDLVVSDNRYGLFTQQVPCIFITHQLLIKAPFGWLETILQRINYHYINRYTACWVPDAAGEPNAAGALSHPAKKPSIPVHYIGLLSRFQETAATTIVYDYCILLSGPEPQRTLLETKLLAQLAQSKEKILLVRGMPGSSATISAPEHITVENHLANNALQQAIQESVYILSRSGYTTVMELLTLQKKAILIPTPGQTEQEYLAEKLYHNKYCYTIAQDRLNGEEYFEQAKAFPYQNISLPLFNPETIIDLINTSISNGI